MKLFVIDTARIPAWEMAFPNALHVCNGGVGILGQIGADDVVFAHTHETAVADNPDLVLVAGSLEPNVSAFCQKVREAAQQDRSPRIILYSGERVAPPQAEYWKKSATAVTGPFLGVPLHQIDVLRDAIPRGETYSYLKEVVNAVLQKLKASSVPIPTSAVAVSVVQGPSSDPIAAADERPSISVAEQLNRNAEAVLAARLIIDADEQCKDRPSTDCQGITIFRPDADLIDKAHQVIQAQLSHESLDAAVQEFHFKLGVQSEL